MSEKVSNIILKDNRLPATTHAKCNNVLIEATETTRLVGGGEVHTYIHTYILIYIAPKS